MEEHDEKECAVRFEIIDNGIGISRETMEHLGEAFEQADNSITRKFNGMGLSLPIAKRIIGLMKGEMRIESKEGEGSCFSFIVRFDVVNQKDGETDKQESDFYNLRGRRVLIVDDIAINREILVMMLEDTGAILDEACNGDEAVKMFLQNMYNLILMDLHMPVMDGYTSAKTIRSSKRSWAGTVPIISISAEAGAGHREKCKEAGITDCLVKPVAAESLFKLISKYMAA